MVYSPHGIFCPPLEKSLPMGTLSVPCFTTSSDDLAVASHSNYGHFSAMLMRNGVLVSILKLSHRPNLYYLSLFKVNFAGLGIVSMKLDSEIKINFLIFKTV